MQIINNKTIRLDNGKLHVHCGPQFLPSQNKAIGPNIYGLPFGVVITPTHTGGKIDGGWIISYDNNQVELVPQNTDFQAAIISTPKKTNVFGNIIDPTKISSNTLTFAINGSQILSAVDGVSIGVFFDKWTRLFGDRCTITPTSVSIDITTEKTAGTPIDLDPSVTDDTTYSGGTFYKAFDTDWATTRSGDATAFYAYCCYSSAQQNNEMDRGVIRFDTSGITGEVISAVLSYPALECMADTMHVRAAIGLSSDLTATTNWGGLLGDGTDLGTITSGPNTLDLTAGYASPNMDLSFLSSYDASNTEPPDDTRYLAGWVDPVMVAPDSDSFPFVLEVTTGSTPPSWQHQ